jgi:ribose transport system substrate-binding protein
MAIVAVTCLGISGCGDPEQVLRIVVIPKGLTHEFWQSIHRGAEKAAQDLTELGMPTRVIWDGPLRERDSLAQIRIVDRRVGTGVDGIVLAPQHSQTMTGPVRRGVEHGVPAVIVDSGLADPELFIKYVATDNYHGGWLAGEHLIKVLQAEGKKEPRLVLFRYAVGSESTEQREKGFEDYVNKYIEANHLDAAKVWLSRDKYAGATKDSAMKEAAPLVNRLGNDIDGIFAVNESSASGMLEALKGLGLNKKIHLMGFDTSDPLLQAIEDGNIDGVIAQDPYRMGYLGVWTVVHYLHGYDVNAGGKDKVLSTGEYLIIKENLHDQKTQELFRPALQVERKIQPPPYRKRE